MRGLPLPQDFLVFFLILLTLIGLSESAPIGNLLNKACKTLSQCQNDERNTGLVCKAVVNRCQCLDNFVWYKSACYSQSEFQKHQKAEQQSDQAALIVTILVPVIGAVLITTCIGLMCFYWVQGLSKTVTTEMSKHIETYEEHELDTFNDGSEEQEEEQKEQKANAKAKKEENKKTKKALQDKKHNAIENEKNQEESQITNGHVKVVVEDEQKHSSPAVQVNGKPKSPLSDHTLSAQKDGYQASMKRLLTMPEMHSEPAGGINQQARPLSAYYLTNSRPTTGMRRPLSAATFLTPKLNGSAIARSGHIGPYITDPSIFRARSPVSPGHTPVNRSPKPDDFMELYDKIATLAEQTTAQDKNSTEDKSEKDSDTSDHEDIQEIKLVKVAAKAFKRRRNMRKVKEEQRRKRKGKKFESIVDQIMRIREEEEAKPKPLPQSAKNLMAVNGKRRGSKTSQESGSNGRQKSLVSANGRPESVAQRVLRERQEKKITAKVPVTSKPVPPKREKSPEVRPLYEALRQSASKNNSKELIRERIRQQVHLNAVKNYQTPPNVSLEFSSESQKPIKSILKKNGAKSTRKSPARVNYAFDFNTEQEIKAQVHAQ